MEKSPNRFIFQCLFIAGCSVFSRLSIADSETYFKGYIGIDGHYYPQEAVGEQRNGSASLITELEVVRPISDQLKFRIKPFFRLDANNSERNSAQLKELELQYTNNNNYWDIGQAILSWSTTEAVNVLPLVIADVVNRRDYVADADGQQKLGRPMLSYRHLEDQYSIQLYYFPYFIADEFGDIHARESLAQGQFSIDNDPLYAGANEEQQTSAAARVELEQGNTNYSAFVYQGYGSTQQFSALDTQKFAPVYDIERTYGLTSQTATDNWLLKSELAYHQVTDQVFPGNRDTKYLTGILGAEYTLVFYELDSDLVMFTEYIYDERDESIDASPFENDLFLGTRWSLNDQQSTVVTAGMVRDLDENSTVVHLNVNRRILTDFSVDLTLRYYAPEQSTSLYPLHNDSLVKLIFKYHL